MVMAGALIPALDHLWLSQRAARAVAAAGLDPRNGVTPGPVAVVGYAEPSLVFLLGTATQQAGPDAAAVAASEGRPVLVEERQEPPFRAALRRQGDGAVRVGHVTGFDYSNGDPATLGLWRSRTPATQGAVISAPRIP